MNKRKIDVNDLKKKSIKGKKQQNVNVKYDIVLAYFKKKEVKGNDIFQTSFLPLISDLLQQLASL